MRDQLPQQPNGKETGIINLDNKNGPGTHWVAYEIDPRGIVNVASYGLAPPVDSRGHTSENVMLTCLKCNRRRGVGII